MTLEEVLLGLKTALRSRLAYRSALVIALLVAISSGAQALSNYTSALSSLALRFEKGGLAVKVGSYGEVLKDYEALSFRGCRADLIVYSPVNASKGKEGLRTLLLYVSDLDLYLKVHRVRVVNGTLPKGPGEALVGFIAADLLSVGPGDRILLASGERSFSLRVSGVARCSCPSDLYIVVRGGEGAGGSSLAALEIPAPGCFEGLGGVLRTGDLGLLVSSVNSDLSRYIGLIAFISYLVVSAVSYTSLYRFVMEFREPSMIVEALGGSRGLLKRIALSYSLAVSLAGGILGVSLGLVGAEASAAVVRWLRPGAEIGAYLDPLQVLMIVGLSVASGLLGSLIALRRLEAG